MSDQTEELDPGMIASASAVSSFKVKEYVNASQLKKDLAFRQSELGEAMMEQASMFAHYGIQAALASKQVNTLEMLLDTAEATVKRQIRDRAALSNEKTTVDSIAAEVSRNKQVLGLKRALNHAKEIEAVAKIATEAFRHRRDMLVQTGLITREEMKGELSISAKNAREQEIESTKDNVLARRAERLRGGIN